MSDYQKGFEAGQKEMILKLQCCANCKKSWFGHKCSKGQGGECKDYSLWEIHNYDCVEM